MEWRIFAHWLLSSGGEGVRKAPVGGANAAPYGRIDKWRQHNKRSAHRAPRPAQQKQGPRQSEIPVPESKSDRTARRCMQSDRYLQMKVSQRRDLSMKSAF